MSMSDSDSSSSGGVEYKTFRQISRDRLLHEMLRSTRVKDSKTTWKVLIMDKLTTKIMSYSCKMADITEEGVSCISALEPAGSLLKECDVSRSAGGEANPLAELAYQAEDKVGNLVKKMRSQVHVVGDGLVGHAAVTGSHQWILQSGEGSEAQQICFHVDWLMTRLLGFGDMNHQIFAGIKTITIIPVLPHGVVQLGSIQMSYDATTHFESTVQDVISLYSKITGKKASTSSAAMVSDYVGYLGKGQIPPKHLSLINSQVSLNIEGSKYTIDMVRGGPRSYKLTLNGSKIEAEIHTLRDGGLLMQLNMTLQQSYSYYSGDDGSGVDFQASGACIFRPNGIFPIQSSGQVPLTIMRGPVLDEVHQQINPWIYQVTRLYKGKEHAEFEVRVGPVPVDDEVGKEVVTQISTHMTNDRTFFTDSNGRDFIKRGQTENSLSAQKKGIKLQTSDPSQSCQWRECHGSGLGNLS